MTNRVVAHANSSALSLFHKSSHRPPRFLPEAFNRPMDQVQVQVGEVEPSEALLASLHGRTVALVAVPELSGHKDLVPGQAALTNSITNIPLVPVYPGSVEESVPRFQGISYSVSGPLPRRRLPHAKAQYRNLHSTVQFELGLQVKVGQGTRRYLRLCLQP